MLDQQSAPFDMSSGAASISVSIRSPMEGSVLMAARAAIAQIIRIRTA